MNVGILIALFVYGLVIGSFFHVLGSRWIKDEDICGRSKCTECGYQLKAGNLIPVISWLAQKGKCSECEVKISATYPAIELLTGVAFVLVYMTHEVDVQTVIGLTFVSMLIVSALTDYQTGYILDRVTVLPTIVIVGLTFMVPDAIRLNLVPAAVVLILFAIVSKLGYLGKGDILPMTCTFVVFGMVHAPIAVFISCILTLIYMVFNKQRKAVFMPFWALGNILTYIYIILEVRL